MEESVPLETDALKWGVIPVGVIGGRCDDEDAFDEVAVDDDDDDALSLSVAELTTAVVLNRDEFALTITASG